jgi:argininosuccinate synthase
VKEDPFELFFYLTTWRGKGIGLLDMVRTDLWGLNRAVYMKPPGNNSFAAHRDIEGIAMDREVMRLRNMLTRNSRS